MFSHLLSCVVQLCFSLISLLDASPTLMGHQTTGPGTIPKNVGAMVKSHFSAFVLAFGPSQQNKTWKHESFVKVTLSKTFPNQ